MKRNTFGLITIFALILLACVACKPYDPPVLTPVPSLKEKYADYFPIGSMILEQDVEKAPEVIKKHCSMVTVQFPFNTIHPAENVYQWDNADRLITFANENGIQVRGHVLIGGRWQPDWVFMDNNMVVSKEVLVERMKQHIQTIVGRYKGKVTCWDVVNEATWDIWQSDYINRWQQIIGDEYIELAFRFAHEADPDARLFYNDYGLDMNTKKRQNAYNLMENLLAQGAPVHGIGLQGHWYNGISTVDGTIRAIDLFSSLGLEIQITELDISVYSPLRFVYPPLIPKYETFTEEISLKQAETYYKLFSALRSRRNKITGITFWGLSDDTSWLRHFPDERNDWPLLFDGNYEPKKAFWAVVDF